MSRTRPDDRSDDDSDGVGSDGVGSDGVGSDDDDQLPAVASLVTDASQRKERINNAARQPESSSCAEESARGRDAAPNGNTTATITVKPGYTTLGTRGSKEVASFDLDKKHVDTAHAEYTEVDVSAESAPSGFKQPDHTTEPGIMEERE
ncbi:hypothetical protein ED733_003140 [Metarhizium rileyi]|uniref:Uncharacterized protein n=1 Tax=Metarhizium rileyi (strain RCEF 4871) TaxID=1649241 RepID=A0A5C6G0M9_METRR|nr:hypothetical protein ED733_003140 [Metarhizium rileyi]